MSFVALVEFSKSLWQITLDNVTRVLNLRLATSNRKSEIISLRYLKQQNTTSWIQRVVCWVSSPDSQILMLWVGGSSRTPPESTSVSWISTDSTINSVSRKLCLMDLTEVVIKGDRKGLIRDIIKGVISSLSLTFENSVLLELWLFALTGD